MNSTQQQLADTLFNEAIEYYLGITKEKNVTRAKTLLQELCELGFVKAYNLLGDWYIKGILPSNDYKEAVDLYKRGCKQDNSLSFFRLAKCFEKGIGVDKDVIKALELYKKAFELGNVDSCLRIGMIYENGHGVDKDSLEAAVWYKKGAELGDVDCACNLGFCYFKGKGVKKNEEKARELFLANSDYSPLIQRNIGAIYLKGTEHSKPDKEKAIYWLTKSAENGDYKAARHLGDIYLSKNKDIAMEWYKKAAQGDKKEGAYYYGFYLYKFGSEEEWKKSFSWMKCAAENKYISAEFLVGLFYKCGIGTSVDDVKAFYWFNLAAENDYEQAFSHIGRFYRDGRIVEKNYNTALSWFEKAIASKNDNVRSEALFDYGIMHLDGLGVKKDKRMAIDFLLEAKELGCLNAINKLKELTENKEFRVPQKSSGKSGILRYGNIIEYVEYKINKGCADSNWTNNIIEKLKVYVEEATKAGVISNGKWTLNNMDYAQWVLDVSDGLGLYIKLSKGQRKYYPMYFANLLLTSKGTKFKSRDIRHNMSKINNVNIDVRNVDTIIAIEKSAKAEIKKRQL